MKYFQALPKIVTTDNNNHKMIMTNLLARVSVIPEQLKNPLLYYSYNVQEGETPEIVSSKYYGTVDNFWVVMLSNQILDPQWDWPLSYLNFTAYINDKYGSSSNAASIVHEYTKTISIADVNGATTTTETVSIDETEYYNTNEGTQTINFPDGDVTYITTSKSLITAYDYEISKNEEKRNINLLNVSYLATLQSQLKKLLSK